MTTADSLVRAPACVRVCVGGGVSVDSVAVCGEMEAKKADADITSSAVCPSLRTQIRYFL